LHPERDSEEDSGGDKPKKSVDDEDLEKKKLLALIRAEVPMPAARNIGKFGSVELVNGVDLEERKVTGNSDATAQDADSFGANPFAADIDEIENSYDAERKLLQKYGSSHGPPRSKPVTPGVIEAYLSNHSHFVCSRGFLPNASQQNGQGLRVHIYGRAIRTEDEAVERHQMGAYMHLDANGVFFGRRNLSPDWEIIQRIPVVEEYLAERVKELIQDAKRANRADTDENRERLDKELRVLSLHELRQRARQEGVEEKELQGTSPAVNFLDGGWMSADVYIKNVTTGTYLRGDPQDLAEARHAKRRERMEKYGGSGALQNKKELFKDKNRQYHVVSLEQDQNIQDQNMWRLEWPSPQLTIMEWVEKLEVLGKNETNRRVVEHHFQKLLEQDVLGTNAMRGLKAHLDEDPAEDDNKKIVALQLEGAALSWKVISDWADLLSEPATNIYCDMLHTICRDIDPEDIASDLRNGGYDDLHNGSRTMLACISRDPVSNDDIESDRIIELLVEGNHYLMLMDEMRSWSAEHQQDEEEEQDEEELEPEPEQLSSTAATVDHMSNWSVLETAEWIARNLQMSGEHKDTLESRIQLERDNGKTLDTMDTKAMERVVDGLLPQTTNSLVADTRGAVHLIIQSRHAHVAVQEAQRAAVSRWLLDKDLADLRKRAQQRKIDEKLWTHGRKGEPLSADGPLRAWLTRRGVAHIDQPKPTSDEDDDRIRNEHYQTYLRQLVSRCGDKSYLHSHSGNEGAVMEWKSYRPREAAADLSEYDTSWKICWDDNCVLDGPAVSVEGIVEIQQYEWAESPANDAHTTESRPDGDSPAPRTKTIEEVRHNDGAIPYGSPSTFRVSLSAYGDTRSEVCALSKAGDVISLCLVPTSFDLLSDLHDRKYEWLIRRWQKAINLNYKHDPDLPRYVEGSNQLQQVIQKQEARDRYHRRPMRAELYDDLIHQIAEVEVKGLSDRALDMDEAEKRWRQRHRRTILMDLTNLERRWSDLAFGPRGVGSIATAFTVDTFPQVEWTDWWTDTSAVKEPVGTTETVTVRSEWKVNKGLAKMMAAAGLSEDATIEDRWTIVLRQLIIESQTNYVALERLREKVRDDPEAAKDTMKYVGPQTDLNEIRPQLAHLETNYEMRVCFRSGHRQSVDFRRMPFRRIDFVADVFHNTLMIQDTGLGMAQRDIEIMLGRLRRSADGDDGDTNEDESASSTRYIDFKRDMRVKPRSRTDPNASVVGQLSMGFWGLFAVAEKVTVVTVDWETKEQMYWTLPKPPSNEEEAQQIKQLVMNGAKTSEMPQDYPHRDLIAKDLGRGTKIILNLQESDRDVLADGLARMETFLQDQSCFTRFPVCLWEKDKSPPFVEVHLADAACQCRVCIGLRLTDAASKMSLSQMWELIDEHNAGHIDPVQAGEGSGCVSTALQRLKGCFKQSAGAAGSRMGLRDLHREFSRAQLLSALGRRGFEFEERRRYAIGKRYKLVKKARAKRDTELILGRLPKPRKPLAIVVQTAFDALSLLLWSMPIVIFLAVAFGDLRDAQSFGKFFSASVQILTDIMSCHLESNNFRASAIGLLVLWWLTLWSVKTHRRNTTDAVRHGSRRLPGERRIVAYLNRPVVVHTVIRSSVPFKDLDLTWYRLTQEHSSYFGFLQGFLGHNMQYAFGERDFPQPPQGKELTNRIWRAFFVVATNVGFDKFMVVCTMIETAGLACSSMNLNLFGLDIQDLYAPGGALWYMHLIFVVESLLKIGGLGAMYYFFGNEKWNNRLDCVLAYTWYVYAFVSKLNIHYAGVLRVIRVAQAVRDSLIAQASVETLEQTEAREQMRATFLGEDHAYQNRRKELNLLLSVFPHPKFQRLFRNAHGGVKNPKIPFFPSDDRDWGIGIKWGSWFKMELGSVFAKVRQTVLPDLFSCTYLRRRPKQVAWYDGFPIEIVRKPLTLLSKQDKYFVRLFGRRVQPSLAHMNAKVSHDEEMERKQREWAMESAINAVHLSPQSDEKLARLHKTAMAQPNQGAPVQDWGLRSEGVRANGIVLDYETKKVYIDGSREMYEAMDEDVLRRLCKNNNIKTTEELKKGLMGAVRSKTGKVRDLTKYELVLALARQSEETGQVIRPSASRAQYCEKHKRMEDRRVHLTQCTLCSETSQPKYGDPKDGIARFCEQHKHDDHVNVLNKCCEAEDCSEKAEYGHLCRYPCPFSMANACAGNRRWYYETKVTAQIVSHVTRDWNPGHFRCEAKLKSEPKVWDTTVPLRLDKEASWVPYATFWLAALVLGGGFGAFVWFTFSSSLLAPCGPQACDVFHCAPTSSLFTLDLTDGSPGDTSTTSDETTANQTAPSVADSGRFNESETLADSAAETQPDTATTSRPSGGESMSGESMNATDPGIICSRPSPRRLAAMRVPLTYEALDPWRCESQFGASPYNLSNAVEELSRMQFAVTGVACSPGYEGSPVVSACTGAGEEYTMTGCVDEGCNTWGNFWLFIGAVYTLRVACLSVLHIRSRYTEFVEGIYGMVQHVHLGRINRHMFANSISSSARVVQQVSGESTAIGAETEQDLVEQLWPHARMTITYLQLLSVLPIVLQWDHSEYFPFVASLQNFCSKLLDPFATFECLVPEYGSSLRIIFPVFFVVVAMIWMVLDGFTLHQDDVANRVSVERLLGLSAPVANVLSPTDFEDMFEKFCRLHRVFPEVQTTMNKFWVSKTNCGRGQVVIVLDNAEWKKLYKELQDSDQQHRKYPGEVLLEEALQRIRDSFFNEWDRAIKGDTKRSHIWGKHLGLRTAFDVDKTFDEASNSYLITFHQLLPALRERVWRQNELVAYTDDFLFQTRAERLARVHEAEDRVKVNHGLLRRDFAILTSAWALPKIINIAKAMAEGHARKDEGARRMSVFELEKLEKGAKKTVRDDNRLCLEVHVYQSEAGRTRKVIYKALLMLIKHMLDPVKGLQDRLDGHDDVDFQRWNDQWRTRGEEDKEWKLRGSALWDFLEQHEKRLLRVPTGAAHSACKTYRLSHWQVVAAWQALFADEMQDDSVSYESIFAAFDAAAVEYVDTGQGYHMLNEDYEKSLRLETRHKSKRMRLEEGNFNISGNVVAGRTSFEVFKEINAQWETQEGKRAALQEEADEMREFERKKKRLLTPYKPHGFRVFAVLSDAFGRIKAFQSIREDEETFPQELEDDVTTPPPIKYRLKGMYYFSKHILTPLHRHVNLDREQEILQGRLDDYRLRSWRAAQTVAFNRCGEMMYFVFTPLAALAGRIVTGNHHWLPARTDPSLGDIHSSLMTVAGLMLAAALALTLFSLLPVQLKHDVPHEIWGYLTGALLCTFIGVSMTDDDDPWHESFDVYASTSLRYIPVLYAIGIPFAISVQLFHYRRELRYDEDEVDFFEFQTAVHKLRKQGHLNLQEPPENEVERFLKRGFRNLLNARVTRHHGLWMPTTITKKQVDAICASRASWSSWFDTIHDVEPVESLDLSWVWWRFSIPIIACVLWGGVSFLMWEFGLVSVESPELWSTEWWVLLGVEWAPISLVVVTIGALWIGTELKWAARMPDTETHAFVSHNRFIQAQFASIAGPYKTEQFWYESIEYARKLVMTVGLSLFEPGSTEQLFAASVACCVSLCSAVWIEPYAATSLNRTKIANEMVIFLTVVSAIAARVSLSATQQSSECVDAPDRGYFSLEDWATYLEWALSRSVFVLLFGSMLIFEYRQLKRAVRQLLLSIAHVLRVLGCSGCSKILEEEADEEDDEDEDKDEEDEEGDEEGRDDETGEQSGNSSGGDSVPLDESEREQFAIKIQKWWRGARARRTLHELVLKRPEKGVDRVRATHAMGGALLAFVLVAATLWLAVRIAQPEVDVSCQCADDGERPLTFWPTTVFANSLAALWFAGGLLTVSCSYYYHDTWLPHLKPKKSLTQEQIEQERQARQAKPTKAEQKRAAKKAKKAKANKASDQAGEPETATVREADVFEQAPDLENLEGGELSSGNRSKARNAPEDFEMENPLSSDHDDADGADHSLEHEELPDEDTADT
jgi:hypothetical protein